MKDCGACGGHRRDDPVSLSMTYEGRYTPICLACKGKGLINDRPTASRKPCHGCGASRNQQHPPLAGGLRGPDGTTKNHKPICYDCAEDPPGEMGPWMQSRRLQSGRPIDLRVRPGGLLDTPEFWAAGTDPEGAGMRLRTEAIQ